MVEQDDIRAALRLPSGKGGKRSATVARIRKALQNKLLRAREDRALVATCRVMNIKIEDHTDTVTRYVSELTASGGEKRQLKLVQGSGRVPRLLGLLSHIAKFIDDHFEAVARELKTSANTSSDTSTKAATAARGSKREHPTKADLQKMVVELKRERRKTLERMRGLKRVLRLRDEHSEPQISKKAKTMALKMVQAEVNDETAPMREVIQTLRKQLMATEKRLKAAERQRSELKKWRTNAEASMKKQRERAKKALKNKLDLIDGLLRERDKLKNENKVLKEENELLNHFGNRLRQSWKRTKEKRRGLRMRLNEGGMRSRRRSEAQRKKDNQIKNLKARAAELEARLAELAKKHQDAQDAEHVDIEFLEACEADSDSDKDMSMTQGSSLVAAAAEHASRTVEAFVRYDGRSVLASEGRVLIYELLGNGHSPTAVQRTLAAFAGPASSALKLPTERHLRRMRGELRVIAETLAFYTAADPDMTWQGLHVDATQKKQQSFMTTVLQLQKKSGCTAPFNVTLRPAYQAAGGTAEQELQALKEICVDYGRELVTRWISVTRQMFGDGTCHDPLVVPFNVRNLQPACVHS